MHADLLQKSLPRLACPPHQFRFYNYTVTLAASNVCGCSGQVGGDTICDQPRGSGKDRSFVHQVHVPPDL